MKTRVDTRSPVRRVAALVTLSALAILVVPVVALAHDGSSARGAFRTGHHPPAVHTHGIHGHDGGVNGLRWSLHDGAFRSNCGTSADELEDAIGAEGVRGTFLWISLDGDDWIVRDRALVQRARVSVEPMQRLGQEMGRLGGEMGRLGAQQGRFGAEMGHLGGRLGALSARLAVLELRGEDDAAVEREAAAIEREMEELSRRQEALDRRQDASVEGRMDDVGEQMERLGDRMEIVSARAERELKALLKEAIASRRAQRVGDRGDL